MTYQKRFNIEVKNIMCCRNMILVHKIRILMSYLTCDYS